MIEVLVAPRSSRIAIECVGDLQYRVKLTSPPVDDAANRQLIEVLAGQLSVPRRQIQIVQGRNARRKRLSIHGVTAETVQRCLRS
jgi:uncharacterized protein (TIGR00251 family)